MSKCRIVLVGAGSTGFALGLLGDFFRVDDLWGNDVVLFDVNAERLDVTSRIFRKVVEKRNADLKISSTTSLDEAVENSDYLIVTIRVGGLAALKEVIEIPLGMDALQVVGDTVGPSGILKGMLEIPAIVNIARKLQDIAPDALMINSTNPMTPVCRAIMKCTNVESVGFCQGFVDMARLASEILNLITWSDWEKEWRQVAEKVEVDSVGINHLAWTLDIRFGESVYEDFLEGLLLEENKNILVKHPYLVGRDLYRIFGVPPTVNDRHTAEFFHYLYDWMKDPVYGPILRKRGSHIDYEKKTLRKEVLEGRQTKRQRLRRMADGTEEAEVIPRGEHVLDMISAIENDRRINLPSLNTQNKGIISGIAPDQIVEVPIKVDRRGFEPKRTFQLPRAIISILNQHLEKYETLVDGILEKDKDLIVQAIALDPLTPSPDKAQRIFDSFITNSSVARYLTWLAR